MLERFKIYEMIRFFIQNNLILNQCLVDCIPLKRHWLRNKVNGFQIDLSQIFNIPMLSLS